MGRRIIILSFQYFSLLLTGHLFHELLSWRLLTQTDELCHEQHTTIVCAMSFHYLRHASSLILFSFCLCPLFWISYWLIIFIRSSSLIWLLIHYCISIFLHLLSFLFRLLHWSASSLILFISSHYFHHIRPLFHRLLSLVCIFVCFIHFHGFTWPLLYCISFVYVQFLVIVLSPTYFILFHFFRQNILLSLFITFSFIFVRQNIFHCLHFISFHFFIFIISLTTNITSLFIHFLFSSWRRAITSLPILSSLFTILRMVLLWWLGPSSNRIPLSLQFEY